MIKINDRTVIAFHSLIFHKDEVAEFPLKENGWNLIIRLKFNDAADGQSVTLVGNGQVATITFNKWASELGASLVEPMTVATRPGGKTLSLMLTNFRIGSTNKLDLQFMHQEVKP